MPRYFFQMSIGEDLLDLDGTDLPDLAAARSAAVDILAEQLKGSGAELWKAGEWRIQVNDDDGSCVAVVSIIAEPPEGGLRRPAADPAQQTDGIL